MTPVALSCRQDRSPASRRRSQWNPGKNITSLGGVLERRQAKYLQLKNTERAVACAALRTAFQNMDPEKELISFTEYKPKFWPVFSRDVIFRKCDFTHSKNSGKSRTCRGYSELKFGRSEMATTAPKGDDRSEKKATTVRKGDDRLRDGNLRRRPCYAINVPFPCVGIDTASPPDCQASTKSMFDHGRLWRCHVSRKISDVNARFSLYFSAVFLTVYPYRQHSQGDSCSSRRCLCAACPSLGYSMRIESVISKEIRSKSLLRDPFDARSLHVQGPVGCRPALTVRPERQTWCVAEDYDRPATPEQRTRKLAIKHMTIPRSEIKSLKQKRNLVAAYIKKGRKEETLEATEERRTSVRAGMKRKGEKETPEVTEKRRTSVRAGMKRKRERKTPEVTEKRRASVRAGMKRKREGKTPEVTEKRRASVRAGMKRKGEKETAKATEKRRTSVRAGMKRKRDRKTPEATEKRRASLRAGMKRKGEKETPKAT
ncbi:hypothetical protein Bbelb_111120 [Branchiostoma belcheri]|nr:hypothetical protein Bbelb_111120 [Branchiostoma belcheri]